MNAASLDAPPTPATNSMRPGHPQAMHSSSLPAPHAIAPPTPRPTRRCSRYLRTAASRCDSQPATTVSHDPLFVLTESALRADRSRIDDENLQPRSARKVHLAQRRPTNNDHHEKIRSLSRQLCVHPDSRSIYLCGRSGNEKLFTMPADGGEVTLAMDMTRGAYTNLRIPAKASSTI